MASKRLSPAANLLRHSKLFSLPPRMPVTRSEIPGSQSERYSDTATLPIPTQAAIETTVQALSHGDWGMKRPLPAKAAQTSTPVLRVHEIDSIDHITEYDSAADHVLTLQKWQEMDIPVMLEQQSKNHAFVSERNPPRSAFELDGPSTAEQSGRKRDSKQRWKFTGPRLQEMSQLEFELYVGKGLKRRRPEFMAMLREHLTQEKAQKQNSRALERGETAEGTVELTEAEFQSGVKRLRSEGPELWALIWKFLDIPGAPPVQSSSAATGFRDAVDQYLGDVDGGPPRTHPSAGLSYTRTNNHVYNHPRLGPLRDRPPVRARVLQHGSLVSSAKSGYDMLGVGGVVATRRSEHRPLDYGRHRSPNRFDDTLVGGAKTWVRPKHAAIGRDGRIKLELGRATEDSSAVWDHYVTPGTAFDETDIAGSLAQANESDRKSGGARTGGFRSLRM